MAADYYKPSSYKEPKYSPYEPKYEKYSSYEPKYEKYPPSKYPYEPKDYVSWFPIFVISLI